MILLWVQDELSFDGYHHSAERNYRVVEVRQEGDRMSEYPSAPFGVTPALKAEFGEAVTPVRFFVIPLSYRSSAAKANAFMKSRGLALLIALLTVSAQAIKAALADPVETLRYE